MDFASFEVQVGAASFRVITREQIAFHTAVASALTGTSEPVRRGGSLSIHVNHHEAVHSVEELPARWGKAFATAQSGLTSGTLSLVVLDFLTSSYSSLREALLIALTTGIADVCRSGRCQRFALLLPKLPGEKGAFRSKLDTFDDIVEQSPYLIQLISRQGACVTYKRGIKDATEMDVSFVTSVEATYGNYEAKLSKKCIRRLGHFRSHHQGSHVKKCRHYSYYLNDCGYELTSLFDRWWQSHCTNARAILYDVPTNDFLREVVVAHSTKLNIPSERIVDVIANESLANELRVLGGVVLVLDVIDTGTTLERYSRQLGGLGINLWPEVLVAISKTGRVQRFPVPSLQVHALLVKTSDALAEHCPQCALRLPFSSDAGEEILRIRSYDLLWMISEVGWAKEPEQEVPVEIGSPYTLLPNFAIMLERFGDWIGYKMYNGLRATGLPEAWFVLHPDEADSSSLSERLNDSANGQLTIIRVPRTCITAAQSHDNNWEDVLESSRGETWVEQLSNMADASALIVDIFNASDSTCRSLVALARQCALVPLAYSCVIDFNPNKEGSAMNNVPKIPLYEWQAPRVLHQRGPSHV